MPSWNVVSYCARYCQLLDAHRLTGVFRTARVRYLLIVVVCFMIRIFARGIVAGSQCGNGVWVRSVYLGHITFHLFNRVTKCCMYRSCTRCSGGTVTRQTKKKGLSLFCLVLLSLHMRSSIWYATRRSGGASSILNVSNACTPKSMDFLHGVTSNC